MHNEDENLPTRPVSMSAAPGIASSIQAALALPTSVTRDEAIAIATTAVPTKPIPSETRRLCSELARQARDFYPEHDWDDVEPILQRIWVREPRGIDWHAAGTLIHAAWNRS